MTTFLDGPAMGQNLVLKRAPSFLRVVHNRVSGIYDALDIPEDEAGPNEDVYVYVLSQEPGRCHVLKRPTGSGWYIIAQYKLCPEQPLSVRDNNVWHEWVMSHTHLCKIPGTEIPPHLR